jgi:hypothetical protein
LVLLARGWKPRRVKRERLRARYPRILERVLTKYFIEQLERNDDFFSLFPFDGGVE